MDIFIGSLTAIMSLLSFHFFEKKRIPHIGDTKYIYFLYVVLIAYLIKPSQDPLLWLAFLPLLYCVLDDLKTRTLNIYLPLMTTILFLFFIDSPYFLLHSIVIFLTFLFFSKASKERFVGEGDIYIVLPLLLLATEKAFSLSFLSTLSLLVQSVIVSCLFAATIVVPIKTLGKPIISFPFVPFLVLGFCFVYADLPWENHITTFFFLLCVFLYTVNIGVTIYNRLHKKKEDQ